MYILNMTGVYLPINLFSEEEVYNLAPLEQKYVRKQIYKLEKQDESNSNSHWNTIKEVFDPNKIVRWMANAAAGESMKINSVGLGQFTKVLVSVPTYAEKVLVQALKEKGIDAYTLQLRCLSK